MDKKRTTQENYVDVQQGVNSLPTAVNYPPENLKKSDWLLSCLVSPYANSLPLTPPTRNTLSACARLCQIYIRGSLHDVAVKVQVVLPTGPDIAGVRLHGWAELDAQFPEIVPPVDSDTAPPVTVPAKIWKKLIFRDL